MQVPIEHCSNFIQSTQVPRRRFLDSKTLNHFVPGNSLQHGFVLLDYAVKTLYGRLKRSPSVISAPQLVPRDPMIIDFRTDPLEFSESPRIRLKNV